MNKKEIDEAEVMQRYNEVSRAVKRECGKRYQWSDALTLAARRRLGKRFRGCFARDEIDYKGLEPGDTALVNTHTQSQKGEHWCSVGCDSQDRIVVYDSFGREASKLLHIPTDVNITNTDLDAEQKFQEVDCGPRSVSWCCLFSEDPEAAMLI